MVLTAAEPASRSAGRGRVVRVLVLVVVIGALAGAGYWLGFRVNLQTRSVPVPSAAATPDEVVRTYVEAYNHRDFDTMRTIYPAAQSGYSRLRAMGTLRSVRIVRSGPATASDLAGKFPEPGHSYATVEVGVVYTGLTGADLAYPPGPNGWTYWLGRPDPSEPWTIIDHGTG